MATKTEPNTKRPSGTQKADVKTPGLAPAGDLPRVGDSAHMTAQQDSVSQGTPNPRSDGTGVAPDLVDRQQKSDGGAKGKKGPKVKMGDIVGFVTSGRTNGKFRPAIVIRTTDPEAENADRFPIDLTCFPDAGRYPNNDHLGNVHFREGVLYDQDGADGTWHLLDESEDVLEKVMKRDEESDESSASAKTASKKKSRR